MNRKSLVNGIFSLLFVIFNCFNKRKISSFVIFSPIDVKIFVNSLATIEPWLFLSKYFNARIISMIASVFSLSLRRIFKNTAKPIPSSEIFHFS